MTTITTTWGETYKGIIVMRCQDNTAYLIDCTAKSQMIIYDSQIESLTFVM